MLESYKVLYEVNIAATREGQLANVAVLGKVAMTTEGGHVDDLAGIQISRVDVSARW